MWAMLSPLEERETESSVGGSVKMPRRSRDDDFDSTVGAGAINQIDHIAKVLFVGDAVRSFGREGDFGAEVRGEVVEELDTGDGIKFVAAEQCLHGHGRFGRRNTLTQARGQVRILAERIELAGQQLIEVGLRHARIADYNGVRRDVPQALALGVQPAREAADEVE